ncbi:unnamed protein product [Acanthoscelides obtectus]|uniref:Uncharacterized protein n=1 Tax=Acanthoscelides obtectus TaxID=200917 RepID=A0A9P0M2B9_ACAOB|nr:unnamed protein product [Acanthoscelides obtectus]CAK1656622.1 hypothetical protein AOBTE_LOCUS19836 [Acanthoscelides obtectus]
MECFRQKHQSFRRCYFPFRSGMLKRYRNSQEVFAKDGH